MALASLRASLEVWTNYAQLFPPMNAHSQAAVTAWGCVLQMILLPKTMQHAVNTSALLRWVLMEGKTKHARFKRATLVNCYWNSTSKLLALVHCGAACCRFVLKIGRLSTPLMNRALGFSHWHLPLCHHALTPALAALRSLKKPDESLPAARAPSASI